MHRIVVYHEIRVITEITDRSKAVVLMWSLLAVLVSDFR